MMRLALVVCWSAVVAAQPAAESGPRGLDVDAPEAAQQRYIIAFQLYRDQRFADAAREFDVAATIVPGSAKLAYNAARCWERAGDVEKAIDRYRRYLKLAPDAPDRPAIARTIDALVARTDRSARVLVESTPVGASIFLDGATTAAALTPANLDIAAGQHTLRLELSGYEVSGRPFEVHAGADNRVGFTLIRVREPPPTWIRPTGWTAIGLGVAAAGVSGWLAFAALSARDDADGLHGEPARHASLQDDFEGARLGAILAGGGAVVLAGAGLGLLAWSW